MKVLHLVKTSHGAHWAARQAKVLTSLGVEVHVAVPDILGPAMPLWTAAGAEIHTFPFNLPSLNLYDWFKTLRLFRSLVGDLRPDIIHSHFVITTCIMRAALGKSCTIPRIFQVPGPLHLEHALPKAVELSLAAACDYWVASSKCILQLYLRAGIPNRRLFLSYYGMELDPFTNPSRRVLRNSLGITSRQLVVGNVNHMYPPKYYLGQTVGLKCHEDIIDALARVISFDKDVVGVLVGGASITNKRYEQALRKRAIKKGRGRIHVTGLVPTEIAQNAWCDFDLAVHVPISENCGGVIEPLAAGIPVIASDVGGIPEVVIPERTGYLLPPRKVDLLSNTILEVIQSKNESLKLASNGQKLVREMFNVKRTGLEIYAIYEHLLGSCNSRPPSFDSHAFADQ
jgi:glycosyltransferase involved in cell wall biosynthesis